MLVASVAGALGSPLPLRVIEVGPGTGALAESLLTALDTPIELTLIESDPVAAAAQRQRLARFTTQLEWCDDIAAAPAGAQIVIANELLDAQPVHRLRYDNEWVELMVDWSSDAGFVDHPAPLSDPALAAPLAADQPAPRSDRRSLPGPRLVGRTARGPAHSTGSCCSSTTATRATSCTTAAVIRAR